MMRPIVSKFEVVDHEQYVDILLRGNLEVSGEYLAAIVKWLADWLGARIDDISVGTMRGTRLGIRIHGSDEEIVESLRKLDIFEGAEFAQAGLNRMPLIISVDGGVAHADADQYLTVHEWVAPIAPLTRRFTRSVGLGLYNNGHLGYGVYDKQGKGLDSSFGNQLGWYFLQQQ